jgi:CBS domain-containing protein
MTSPVLGVGPDMTVRELAAFLAEHQITGAPVMDSSRRVVGVVTNSDVAQADAGGARVSESRSDPVRDVRSWDDRLDADDLRHLRLENGEVQVKDIMTPAVYTVNEDTPVPVLARAMVHGRIHRLFVTRAGRVVGVVSSLDLLKLLIERLEEDATGTSGL